MTAAMHTSPLIDPLSPELVLVDAELAKLARSLLPERAHGEQPPVTGAGESRAAAVDELRPGAEVALKRARQRLLDGAVMSEILAESQCRRRITVIPTASAAVAVVLLVTQLYLNQGHLG
jgi:hypothetical protein